MPFRLSALVLGALAVAAVPVLPAGGVGDPCATTWADPAGDTVYNTGTGLVQPAVADDDLDATNVTVRATATDLVATVRVAHLDAAGPKIGTGHGIGLVLTKYGKTMAFSARKDATYGDAVEAPDAASVVRLTVDAKAGTFTLTLRRADLARIAGTPTNGGDLVGIYVTTLRHDQTQAAVNATPLGAGHPGLTADETAPGSRGGDIALDDCDTQLRRTSLSVSVTGPVSRRVVAATLRGSNGAPLAAQPVRLLAGSRLLGTAKTDGSGTARFTLAGGRSVTVQYAGVAGRYSPASGTFRI
jgi:hypothetical protein